MQKLAEVFTHPQSWIKSTSLYFFLYLMSLSTYSMAQGICSDPRYAKGGFSLSSTDICHTETVEITNTGEIEKPKYYYNYKQESYESVYSIGTDVLDFREVKHPGVYTVVQVGVKNGKETVSCIDNVKVRVNNQPVFSYTYCPPSLEISIPKHEINDYDEIEILVNKVATLVKKGDLPYKKSFTVPNSIELKVTGIKGVMMCSTNPSSEYVSYDPVNGNNMPYYPEVKQVSITPDNHVKLELQGQYNEEYSLYRYPATSSIATAKIIEEKITVPSYTDKSLGGDALRSSYCYYIKPYRARSCIRMFLDYAPLCTIPLNDVDIVSTKQNNLQWTAYKSNSSLQGSTFSIHRLPNVEVIKTGGMNNYEVFKLPNFNDFVYKDTQVDCKKRFCYRIKATTSGKVSGVNYGGTSYSNEICVDHKLDLSDFPSDAIVSTKGKSNIITFEGNHSSKYTISNWYLYKDNKNQFIIYDSLSKSPFIFEDKFNDQSEKYTLQYVDECNNRSARSPILNSIFLQKSQNSQLQWTSGTPFAEDEIDHYEVYYYLNENDEDALYSTHQTSTSNSHKIETGRLSSVGTFAIKAVSKGGQESFSNRLSFLLNGYLFVPTIFTPNSDGHNDHFKAEGAGDLVTKLLFEIYTNKGQKVASFSDVFKGWDGNLPNGSAAQEGTYFYVLEAEMATGQKIYRNGSFALQR